MKKKVILILVLIFFITTGIIALGVKQSKNIVARYVTNEHYRYSPVQLNGEIYFPSSYNFKDNDKLKSIGHLGVKDQSLIKDILLDVGNVLVENNDSNYFHLSVQDDNSMNYSSAKYLQQSNYIETNMMNHTSFVLCKDNKNSESRIGIKKELLTALQEKFNRVNYSLGDFKNCKNIYYIYLDSPKEKIHERTFDDPIIFMGCIFVKDGNLYYGNLSNEINGDLKTQLKDYIK